MSFLTWSRRNPIWKLLTVVWFLIPILASLLLLKTMKDYKGGEILLAHPQLLQSCCGPHCRVKKDGPTAHYDEAYFQWQTKMGVEKAQSRDWGKFLNVSEEDTVADLGAGGGHILATLQVKRRIGVEVNGQARAAVKREYGDKGVAIDLVEYAEDLEDGIVDVLFSTSAIEHFECPLTELREMAKKVRRGGRVVIGVKNEGMAVGVAVNENDHNHHLYTWNFQELYNLVSAAGFNVTGFEPSTSYALDVHARNLKYPDSFTSHESSDIYIWVRGVKA